MTEVQRKKLVGKKQAANLIDRDVAIWAAGMAGKRLLKALTEGKLCRTVFWCDKYATEEVQVGGIPVKPVDWERLRRADVVVIAVIHDAVIEEIYDELIENGIDEKRIFWGEMIIDSLEREVRIRQIPSEEVLRANAQSHDEFAKWHEKSVGYIRRRSCRKFYWNMIDREVKRHFAKGWHGLRVLELGCATGTFSSLVSKEGIKDYLGIDVSAEMLSIAKGKHLPKCRYRRVSLEKFAQKESHKGRYDVIYSASFLHHLYDISDGLEKIRDLLTERGIYIAIHEQIRQETFRPAQKADDVLNIAQGYNGFGKIRFSKRMPYIIGTLKQNKGSALPLQHVDYQLNREDFSLEKYCRKYGKVKKYCFYIHMWLRHFDNRPNHEMLIMRKD